MRSSFGTYLYIYICEKVFHGDLATRNILLTGDLRAKVCDFGFAKHLYACTVYVKGADVSRTRNVKNLEKLPTYLLQCPLPIRWMAPESIQGLYDQFYLGYLFASFCESRFRIFHTIRCLEFRCYVMGNFFVGIRSKPSHPFMLT